MSCYKAPHLPDDAVATAEAPAAAAAVPQAEAAQHNRVAALQDLGVWQQQQLQWQRVVFGADQGLLQAASHQLTGC